MLTRHFPTLGCQKAFDCGKDFMIHTGGDESLLPIALTFCESTDEERFFKLGMQEEAADIAEIVIHA